VVTNLNPTHYKAATVFRGLAIDDVIVRGNTTISGCPMPPSSNQGSQIGPFYGSNGQTGPDIIGAGQADIQATTELGK
jgi:hypothetical protein